MNLDSSDSIYILDLNKMNWDLIPASNQKEKNGKELPGPRDDFAFVKSSYNKNTVYLIGGFKNGQKSNDIYRLTFQDFKTFLWEKIDL